MGSDGGRRTNHAEPDGHPAPAKPSPLRGQVLVPGSVIAEKYEVERVLGLGGMGVVVAARHRQLGQRVAIKFLRGEAIKDGSAVERFLREARAAVALSSEHAVRTLDVGTLEDGAPYIIMEYLPGVDLGQLLQRDGPLSVPLAVGAVLQACEAIAEAHALGIVHRDLKPANLFVTTRMDGSPLVKVLDFGISKAAPGWASPEGQNLTASGYIMGSPAYMSPEQVRSTKHVDARSDIWSLGVILYELLTGTSPFLGETVGDTFAKIVSETPVPIQQRRPDVPRALAAAIDQCLQRNLDERVQNVRDLASELLPFASKDAAIAGERIIRASSNPVRGPVTKEATLAASGPDIKAPWGTARTWFHSDARTKRTSRWGLGLIVGGALLGTSVVALLVSWGGLPATRLSATATTAGAARPAPTRETAASAPVNAVLPAVAHGTESVTLSPAAPSIDAMGSATKGAAMEGVSPPSGPQASEPAGRQASESRDAPTPGAHPKKRTAPPDGPLVTTGAAPPSQRQGSGGGSPKPSPPMAASPAGTAQKADYEHF
jgi:serine/threonine-protein kinase